MLFDYTSYFQQIINLLESLSSQLQTALQNILIAICFFGFLFLIFKFFHRSWLDL